MLKAVITCLTKKKWRGVKTMLGMACLMVKLEKQSGVKTMSGMACLMVKLKKQSGVKTMVGIMTC